MQRIMGSGLITLLLLSTSGTSSRIAPQANTNDAEQSESTLCKACRLPVRIILNSSPGKAFVPRRQLYLLIQADDFREENLRQLFTLLSSRFPEPKTLSMIAFSSREPLDKMIKAEEMGVIIDFTNTPEGKRAEKEYYERLYPPKTGYFRAYYYRHADTGEASFQYSPDPNTVETREVKLK